MRVAREDVHVLALLGRPREVLRAEEEIVGLLARAQSRARRVHGVAARRAVGKRGVHAGDDRLHGIVRGVRGEDAREPDELLPREAGLVRVVQGDEVHAFADDPVERASLRREDAARGVENALLVNRSLQQPLAKGPPVIVASPPVELVIADREEHGRLPEASELPLDEVVPSRVEVFGHLEAVELVRRPGLAIVRGVPALQDVAIDVVHPPEIPEVPVELRGRAGGLALDCPRDLGHDEVAAIARISRNGERPGRPEEEPGRERQKPARTRRPRRRLFSWNLLLRLLRRPRPVHRAATPSIFRMRALIESTT